MPVISDRGAELLQKRDSYLKTAENILDKARRENRRTTDAERRDFQNLMDKIDAIDDDLTRTEMIDSRRAAANDTRADQKLKRPGAAVNYSDSEFRGLGDFAVAVANASVVGGAFDARLQSRALSGMGETVASDGGFLVDAPLAEDLLQRVFTSGEIARRVRRIPLAMQNASGIKIPFIDETSRTTGNRLGGVRVYWAAEGDTATASKPKLGQIELGLKKMIALCYVSSELMQDTAAMGAILAEAFRREMVYELEDKIFNGTGAGVPAGILTAGCTVEVAKEGSQAAATINYANVSKMMARLHPASWPTAVWLANVSTLPQLIQLAIPVKNVAATENVGGSGLLYDPNTQRLLGKPVLFIEQAKALGTVGDLVLADPNEYLLIEKQMQGVSSIHVKFLTDETAFRFTWRVDGQPAWKSALTPANGTDTVSPFITLATR